MTGDDDLGELSLQGLKTGDFLRAEARLTLEEKSGLATHLAASLDPDRLSKEDFANAEAILRLLVWNSESHVVEVLARVAAANPHIPKSIAWALANDDETPAAAILEASLVLTDADLIAIVETCESSSKMSAIARRKAVSAEVSRSLVERGDENTVSTLLANTMRSCLRRPPSACTVDLAKARRFALRSRPGRSDRPRYLHCRAMSKFARRSNWISALPSFRRRTRSTRPC